MLVQQIRLAVLTWYRLVTDRQTGRQKRDRRTSCDSIMLDMYSLARVKESCRHRYCVYLLV